MFPDFLAEDVYSIRYDQLLRMGIRGIAVDIDNTLVPMKWEPIPEKTVAWAKRLEEMGFQVVILSNARKEKTLRFMRALGVKGIWLAGKPSCRGYRRAAMIMGLEPNRCVMIGDQLFTDVRGGRKAGFLTILTRPLDRKETLFVRLKRILEGPVFEKYGERIPKI